MLFHHLRAKPLEPDLRFIFIQRLFLLMQAKRTALKKAPAELPQDANLVGLLHAHLTYVTAVHR